MGQSSTRRRWCALVGLALLAGCATGWGPQSVDVSQAQLQRALERQFPIERRVLERWTVRVLTPQLAFEPQDQRLSTTLALEVTDAQTQRARRGRVVIRHGVRFEASDLTVRLTRPQILQVEVDDAPLAMDGPLARAARVWVEQGFDDRIVYTLSARDVQALRSHGWTPAGLSVGDAALRVTLVPFVAG